MPRLKVDLADPLHENVAATVAGLAAANDPREPVVLVRGNELVRMTERGELEPLGKVSLRVLISEGCEFGVHDDKGRWTRKDPTIQIAEAVVCQDSAAYAGVPRVTRVVDVPVVGPDGSLVTEPGFHPESGLFYRPAAGLEDLRAPDGITSQDVDEAVGLLARDVKGLLGAFDFVDESSRAHALGLVLLPFLQDYIGPKTPLHAVVSPEPGTGKTTLARVALAPGCGSRLSLISGGESDEEWRKRITALLIGGSPAVAFDNLSGELDSGALAAALTSGVWRDRVLGASKVAVLPTMNAWVATGNNLGTSKEIARRTVPIVLRAPEGKRRASDRPAEFPHPDLEAWAEANRADLVRAALVLVRHWLDGPVIWAEGGYLLHRSDSGPRDGKRLHGSFEAWSRAVGGVLEAAGIDGFLANRAAWAAEADDGSADAWAFLAAWAEAFPDEEMTAAELATHCQFGGALHDALPAELAGNRALQKDLGYWLRRHKDAAMPDGLRLTFEEGSSRIRRWYVRGAQPRPE